MTIAVIDASIVVRWYVDDDPLHQQAMDIRRVHEAIAPALLQTEVANALWKYVRVDRIQIDDACESVAVLSDLLVLVDDRVLIAAAQQLSARHNHPVYDCLYVILAQREGVGLATADARMARIAAAAGVSTTFIGQA